jgi:uncharacterized phage protein gp47/JayE
MPLTQSELANQMIRQLRVLDPSVSGDLGTPERKIIDTVAQALADSQINLTLLEGAFDLDTKVGETLDRFLSIFGFGRQQGSASVGVVEFTRTTPSEIDLRIPAGTQLASTVQIGGGDQALNQAIFETTSDVYLEAGSTTVYAPVKSIYPGATYNVPANTINAFVGSPVLGITSVTNPNPTVNGTNIENDDEVKVRFKNTIFRNVAGTADQYLALGVAGAFSNKAIVLGPFSRYRERIQVPAVDDASDYDTDGDNNPESGHGNAGEWTTSLSTVPYSKYTHDIVPAFVSNGQTGVATIFYTEGVDYQINTTPSDKNHGDTYRQALTGQGLDPLTDTDADNRPNVTMLNVYTGSDVTIDAVRPDDVVLFEHSYVSSASRNDPERNITNCVDVYLNGVNTIPTTAIIPVPSSSVNVFVDNPSSAFHYDNYRRIGEPQHRPLLGNIFTRLYRSPILDLPDTITTATAQYIKGVHYHALYDASELGGTVRARTGIEWEMGIPGRAGGDPDIGPYTGPKITDITDDSIQISNYTYDRNIADLQASMEGVKQVTTDVLVHQATTVYFKFDVSIMYNTGVSTDSVNLNIQSGLGNYLESRYFGSVVQLSDILQQIHNVPGVDNVRWSSDVDPDLPRIVETDANGKPSLGAIVDRVMAGDVSTQEIQQFYIVAYDAPASVVDSSIQAAGISASVQSGDGSAGSPFRILWDANGSQELMEIDTNLTGGVFIHNADFHLQDNELPTLPTGTQANDTVPGVIIRPRAQNTWERA